MLAREGAELSATESIRVAQEQAGSLSTLVPRYNHAAQLLAEARYRRTALEVLGADNGQLLVSDPAWGAVVRALQDAEALGWRARQLLTEVVRPPRAGHRPEHRRGDRLAYRCATPPTVPLPHDSTSRPRLTPCVTPACCGPFRSSTGPTLDPAAAVQPMRAMAARGQARYGDQRKRTAESAPITDVVTGVLGATLAGRARSEPAWPALEAALRRAQRRGHDPAALLDRLARSRELRTARSISEVLAWRIGSYLASEHTAAAEIRGQALRN